MDVSYTSTHLEDWVTALYTDLQIHTPGDIREELIAEKLGFSFERKNGPAMRARISGIDAIFVDARCSPHLQKEQFFHELCHLLRHIGHQPGMARSFHQLQEWDARNFVRYAVIPYHHLKYIDFSHPNPRKHVSELFGVSYDLAEERLSQIRMRNYVAVTRSKACYF